MSHKLIRQQIQKLEAKHGGLRAAADAIPCDYTYLYRLKVGQRKNPGPRLLRCLGLKKEIHYVLKEKSF